MICPFCNRTIKQEITEKLEVWGVIREFKCPKCFMTLNVELTGRNKWGEEFKSIKDILKEMKLIK